MNEHNFYHATSFTNGFSKKGSYEHAVLYVTTASVSLLLEFAMLIVFFSY